MRCDHIEPVVAPTGFVDWNTYISRMFDSIPDGIQYLCLDCHAGKTAAEREERKKWKRTKPTTELGAAVAYKKSS